MHKAMQQGAFRCCCTLDNLANVLTVYSFLFQSQTPLAIPLVLSLLPFHLDLHHKRNASGQTSKVFYYLPIGLPVARDQLTIMKRSESVTERVAHAR